MDPGSIRGMCLKAVGDMLAYSELYGANESVVRVRRYRVSPRGSVVMQLDAPLTDTSGVFLRVNGDVFEPGCFEFTFCDPRSKTAGVRFTQGDVSAIFSGDPEVEVVCDLSFLVRQAGEYFERFGLLIGYPDRSPSFQPDEHPFPCGVSPTPGQREAVERILSCPLSYVWGAPGTGKTQMVLATSIMAYVRRGMRVAVIAPTNNAVEQVLRGLVSAIKGDPGYGALIDTDRDVARIGTPTPSFLKEHPGMCEPKATENAVRGGERERAVLQRVLSERELDRAREYVLECMSALDERRLTHAGIEADRALAHLNGSDRFRRLRVALGDLDREDIGREYDALYSADRPLRDLSYYRGCSDEDIRRMMVACTEIPGGTADPETCMIVACTPQTYMTRFCPNGQAGDKPPFNVDHVFVDEAGYCNCLMCLALMANRVPLTLLGDHKQLPPVCTVDQEELRRYIERGGFMSRAFLWSQSALFAESVLLGTEAGVCEAFLQTSDPVFKLTGRADLTESHRFGANLGEILDRYVYGNGVTGLGEHPLEVICIDVTCGPRDRRVNMPEAEAIRAFLDSDGVEDYCVLSPYRTQVDVLRDVMPSRESRILTVHRSQGREWDTVVLSVQDGEGCDREVPLRFTSSQSETGLKVINTAVSRAKRRLVVACDRSFWLSREDELIRGLVGSPTCRTVRWVDGRLADPRNLFI